MKKIKGVKLVYDIVQVISPKKMITIATYEDESDAKNAYRKIQESQKKVVMVCPNIKEEY